MDRDAARAGMLDDAKEVLFTGLDRGVQGEVDQWYQRALLAADGLHPGVLLAYELKAYRCRLSTASRSCPAGTA